MLTKAVLEEMKRVNKNATLLYAESEAEHKVAQNTLALVAEYENLVHYKHIRDLEDRIS